ncbi:hypothetical protein AB0G15_06930 [Streptosporangium sp. NPDC023825]|uniref:hypothetical protein n=1 Tax=Streptosporangium sp. NPDC023825 TaxID=3154909 RepID=UPI0034170629
MSEPAAEAYDVFVVHARFVVHVRAGLDAGEGERGLERHRRSLTLDEELGDRAGRGSWPQPDRCGAHRDGRGR